MFGLPLHRRRKHLICGEGKKRDPLVRSEEGPTEKEKKKTRRLHIGQRTGGRRKASALHPKKKEEQKFTEFAGISPSLNPLQRKRGGVGAVIVRRKGPFSRKKKPRLLKKKKKKRNQSRGKVNETKRTFTAFREEGIPKNPMNTA